jgi:hypothetical protein
VHEQQLIETAKNPEGEMLKFGQKERQSTKPKDAVGRQKTAILVKKL